MMLLLRCHAPKIARRAALDHTNGNDLGNQSRRFDRSTPRRSTVALTGIGNQRDLIVLHEPHWLTCKNSANLSQHLDAFNPKVFASTMKTQRRFGSHWLNLAEAVICSGMVCKCKFQFYESCRLHAFHFHKRHSRETLDERSMPLWAPTPSCSVFWERCQTVRFPAGRD